MQLFDVRKRRKYLARDVRVIIMDSNHFSRSLMAEILRTLGVTIIETVKEFSELHYAMEQINCNLVLLEWSEQNTIDPVSATQRIRQMHDDRYRRVPIIGVSGQITKEMVLAGRNAGMDEFLRKPCSPRDVEMRLKMVIETPRPFVDSKNYTGPCRRRKNPADYHGDKRRRADEGPTISGPTEAEKQLVDNDNPMATALARLKMAATLLHAGKPEAKERVAISLKLCKEAAIQTNDKAFARALKAFDYYLRATLSSKRALVIEKDILLTGISTLEQLLVLPREYDTARETVANAYQDAIQRKIAV